MPAISGAVGGGALVGTILAALGLRKLIKGEVKSEVAPIEAKVDSMQNELTEFKLTGFMTTDSHSALCKMNARYIDTRMTSLQNTLDLQVNGIKEHIDSQFSELTRRLDRRRSSDCD